MSGYIHTRPKCKLLLNNTVKLNHFHRIQFIYSEIFFFDYDFNVFKIDSFMKI